MAHLPKLGQLDHTRPLQRRLRLREARLLPAQRRPQPIRLLVRRAQARVLRGELIGEEADARLERLGLLRAQPRLQHALPSLVVGRRQLARHLHLRALRRLEQLAHRLEALRARVELGVERAAALSQRHQLGHVRLRQLVRRRQLRAQVVARFLPRGRRLRHGRRLVLTRRGRLALRALGVGEGEGARGLCRRRRLLRVLLRRHRRRHARGRLAHLPLPLCGGLADVRARLPLRLDVEVLGLELLAQGRYHLLHIAHLARRLGELRLRQPLGRRAFAQRNLLGAQLAPQAFDLVVGAARAILRQEHLLFQARYPCRVRHRELAGGTARRESGHWHQPPALVGAKGTAGKVVGA